MKTKFIFCLIISTLLIFCFKSVIAQPVTFKKVFTTGSEKKPNCYSYNYGNNFIISTSGGIFKLDKYGNIIIQKLNYGKIIFNKVDTTFSFLPYSTYSQGFFKLDTLLNPVLMYRISYQNVHYSFPPSREGSVACIAYDNSYLHGGRRGDTALFFKTDINGNVLWSKCFSPILGGDVKEVLQSSDSCFIMATSFISATACLIKTDPSGNVLWAKSYVRPKGYITSLIEENDGSLLFAGFTDSSNTNWWAPASSIFLIKTDYFGNVLWAKTYGDNISFRIHWEPVIKKTPDGGYIIVATLVRSEFYPFPYRDDLILIKTDINGDTVWTRAHGSPDVTIQNTDIDVLQDGYLIVANTNNGVPVPGTCSYLIRSDTLGHTTSFCQEYNPLITVNNLSVNDSIILITTIPLFVDTVLFVENNVNTNNIAYDGCNLSEIQNQLQAPDSVLSIYPNPCNGLFTLEINNSTITTATEIEVYNSNGQKIYSSSITSSSCNIDITGFAEGLYFIRVINENGIKVGKVMVE